MKKEICFLLALALLFPGIPASRAESETGAGKAVSVRKVENLPEDFILGMDVSSVLSLEASGVVFRDAGGREADLFDLLQQAGVNWIRVRIWNDPFTADGRGYGGGNCDLRHAVEIGRRAAEHGMKLLADFHYSDFWADPGKQMAPRAWEGLSVEEKADALYAFTLESLAALREGGADVGMVQIGNETNGAFCGEKNWADAVRFLIAAGCRAVRDFDPAVRTAVHFTNPERAGALLERVASLAAYGLDYDILAVSWYPFWHGTLENLASVLRAVRETYGRDVLVAETSYPWTLADSDFFGNTVGEGSSVPLPWPVSPQGQADAVRDLAAAVCEAGGLGFFYWEGAWISVGTVSWEENRKKWEAFGSGWASSYAAEYDPHDAGKYFGGCAVDNQAFFAPDGSALDSLQVFRLLREGREASSPSDIP